MRLGLRPLPLDALTRRYIDGGHGRLGGLWVDAGLVAGLSADALIEQLGLGFRMPDGAVAYGSGVAAVRFPVTGAVLSHSVIASAAPFVRGGLPGPGPGAAWTGNGFTRGGRLVPEYRLAAIVLPERAELLELVDAQWRVLGRRVKGAWR